MNALFSGSLLSRLWVWAHANMSYAYYPLIGILWVLIFTTAAAITILLARRLMLHIIQTLKCAKGLRKAEKKLAADITAAAPQQKIPTDNYVRYMATSENHGKLQPNTEYLREQEYYLRTRDLPPAPGQYTADDWLRDIIGGAAEIPCKDAAEQ